MRCESLILVKKLVLIVICAFINSSALAGSWTGYVSVTHLYANSDQNNGTVYIYTAEKPNPEGCANNNYLALLKSNSVESEIVSMLLAGSMSGKDVNFYVGGCDPDTRNPMVRHLKLAV